MTTEPETAAPPAKVGVEALRAYYRRVHGAMVQAGFKRGILGLRQFPFPENLWATAEVEPGAEEALRIIMALGIPAPKGWER